MRSGAMTHREALEQAIELLAKMSKAPLINNDRFSPFLGLQSYYYIDEIVLNLQAILDNLKQKDNDNV
jgi:hypothetical protein